MNNLVKFIINFALGFVIGSICFSIFIGNVSVTSKIIGNWQTNLGNANMVVFKFMDGGKVILSSSYASIDGNYVLDGDNLKITGQLESNATSTINYRLKFITDNSISLQEEGQTNGLILSRIY